MSSSPLDGASVTASSRLQRAPSLPLVVLHPSLPTPILDDGGPTGSSAGDVRFWSFPSVTLSGDPVQVDWLMSTTAGAPAAEEEERRISDAVFTFGRSDRDQIVLNGVASYPSGTNTLQPSSVAIRAMTGGTGRYAQASGQVFSERYVDGSWSHSFLFGTVDVVVGTAQQDVLKPGSAPSSCLAGLEGADRFRFTQRENRFHGSIDQITDFNQEAGDVIQLAAEAFPGLQRIRLNVVNSNRQLRREAARASTVVFDRSTGFLWVDINGSEPGWGVFGGAVVAIAPIARITAAGLELV